MNISSIRFLLLIEPVGDKGSRMCAVYVVSIAGPITGTAMYVDKKRRHIPIPAPEAAKQTQPLEGRLSSGNIQPKTSSGGSVFDRLQQQTSGPPSR